ncbi:MAG: (Fe-S)-binding protein [Acidobacteria bacterium]|nr:(Fe-S)-binding protein [Acidobacteriota bacterium]
MSRKEFTQISRVARELEQCMKCGFCAYVCPVYQEEKTEASLARGKNELVKLLVSGELEINRELADRLYKCTGCMTCTTNCPARAEIPRIVVAARADIAGEMGMRFPYGLIYRQVLAKRGVMGLALAVASRLQGVLMPRTSGTLRHMPDFVSAFGKGRRIPSVARKFLRRQVPEVTPAAGRRTLRVGYFSGCMNEFVSPEIGRRTIGLLARRGVEVVFPRAQGCCGAAVFLGAGDFETARKMADRNAAAFEGLDYVVTDCATCACALTEYAHFLADTPEREEAYARFSGKVRHVASFLVDVLGAADFRAPALLDGKKVTWHDPCHLNRHLGVREQPRRILESLDGVRYVEMPEADRCCGMGGQFNLLHYELSMKIAKRKSESIEAADADIVVTACPGCQLQLADSASRLDKPQRVMSLMDVIE